MNYNFVNTCNNGFYLKVIDKKIFEMTHNYKILCNKIDGKNFCTQKHYHSHTARGLID